MLQIKHLSATVANTQILFDLNLTIKPGEIHAIMGPNGSGKSTLANMLAGHPSYQIATLSPKSAQPQVKLNGQDLLAMSPDERARAGLFLAFQYPVEVPGVRVNKFLRVAYQARFEDQSSKHFNSVLEFNQHLESLAQQLEVNPELLRRGLNEGFSGGEKKRLEILAMALLEPNYALLDETDSGLDIDAIKAVAKGINTIVDKFNTGVIIITHYQRILQFIKPTFVHVMKQGKIVESGGGELAEKLEKKGYKNN